MANVFEYSAYARALIEQIAEALGISAELLAPPPPTLDALHREFEARLASVVSRWSRK
jgi:hypothetical protein